MKKFLIFLFFLILPAANAGSVCEKYFTENNKAYKYKENMDQFSIEYSFKKSGKFDEVQKNINWSDRYSSFIDWQKCNSVFLTKKGHLDKYMDGSIKNVYDFYNCNGKKFLFIKGSNLVWFDLEGNMWKTYAYRDDEAASLQKYGYKTTFDWASNKCEVRDGYYTDSHITLFHQYNEILDQYWAAIIEVRSFYEIVTPQF